MNNKTIKILSRHNTLAEAVEAAKPDLSYNERSARESISLTDRGYNRDRGVTSAYVCEDGKIRFVYQSDIALLNEFSPFSSCLHDSPFQFVFIHEAENNIMFERGSLAKTAGNRKMIREMQKTNSDAYQLVVA